MKLKTVCAIAALMPAALAAPVSRSGCVPGTKAPRDVAIVQTDSNSHSLLKRSSGKFFINLCHLFKDNTLFRIA